MMFTEIYCRVVIRTNPQRFASNTTYAVAYLPHYPHAPTESGV